MISNNIFQNSVSSNNPTRYVSPSSKNVDKPCRKPLLPEKFSNMWIEHLVYHLCFDNMELVDQILQLIEKENYLINPSDAKNTLIAQREFEALRKDFAYLSLLATSGKWVKAQKFCEQMKNEDLKSFFLFKIEEAQNLPKF